MNHITYGKIENMTAHTDYTHRGLCSNKDPYCMTVACQCNKSFPYIKA